MKIAAIVLASLALVSGVARADFKVAPPPYWPDGAGFDCGVLSLNPPDGDRDPIKNITIKTIANDAGNLTSLEVTHHSVFGKSYVRSEQYGRSVLRQEPNRLDATWVGTLNSNSNVTMAGHIFNRDGKWFYREMIMERGRIRMDMLAGCQPQELE
jgi:hypothetical protein